MLYSFFWVIRRGLNFICRRFGTLPYEEEQSVPKRRHMKFRRWGITQKTEYNKEITSLLGSAVSNPVM
jgi:hypothetical protein